MQISRTRLGALLAGTAIIAAACSSSNKPAGQPPAAQSGNGSPAASGAVLSVRSTSLGKILVDDKGMTVYGFAIDKPGVSNCSGSCAHYWPIVPAPSTLPTSLPGITAKIGEITRSDGKKQLTVDNLPVYTYVGDTKPGVANGQGLNLSGGLWWVVGPNGKWITTTSGSSSSSSSGGGGGGYGGGY